jgi:hypothetical protein
MRTYLKCITAAAFVFVPACLADILEVRGSVNAAVEEVVDGSTQERNEVDEFLPETRPVLPIRVLASIAQSQASQPAAGLAAAQISDITKSTEPNPQDFSLVVALNSLNPNVLFRGRAKAEETRVVRFSRAQLGLPNDVNTRMVDSRFHLDGVLALFSATADRDFTDAGVVLRLEVEQRVSSSGGEPQIKRLLEGTVEVRGVSGGGTIVTVSGAIPADRIVSVSLTTTENGLSSFPAAIIPQIVIPYAFEARVDQTFELVARISVEAECASPDAGAVALIGTPVDDLRDVIDEVSVPPLTAGAVETVDKSRNVALGAGDMLNMPPVSGLGICGLLGFESLLGFMALAGLRGRWCAAGRFRR